MNEYVYIIELEQALGNARHSARFYVGYTTRTPQKRLATHRAGKGAAMLREANRRGIAYKIVHEIECGAGEGRAIEKRIKAYKNTAKWLQRNAYVQ